MLTPSDPVTTDLIAGGAHVGQTVYLEEGDALEILSHGDFAAHEPTNMRALLLETLRDPERLPAEAWAYHEPATLTPERDALAAGTRAEYALLVEAVRGFYEREDLWFDGDAFDAGVTVFMSFLEAE